MPQNLQSEIEYLENHIAEMEERFASAMGLRILDFEQAKDFVTQIRAAKIDLKYLLDKKGE